MVINKLNIANISTSVEKAEKISKKDKELEKVSQDFEAIFIKRLFIL